jgi:isopentenyl diphosphate isomerase/L-lactate dehydrogenase-like FMN-dependent dehydrogenase
VNRDRAASEKAIAALETQGFKAVMFTVDAVAPGKRELDQRAKGDIGAAVSTRAEQPPIVNAADASIIGARAERRGRGCWPGRGACACAH